MNTETLDLRIQNIKAAIERETDGLTADELKVVHAAVATVPSVPGERIIQLVRDMAHGWKSESEREDRLPTYKSNMAQWAYAANLIADRLNSAAPSTPSSSSLARRIRDAVRVYFEKPQLSTSVDPLLDVIIAELAATPQIADLKVTCHLV